MVHGTFVGIEDPNVPEIRGVPVSATAGRLPARPTRGLARFETATYRHAGPTQQPTVVRSTHADRRAEHGCRPSCGARRVPIVRATWSRALTSGATTLARLFSALGSRLSMSMPRAFVTRAS